MEPTLTTSANLERIEAILCREGDRRLTHLRELEALLETLLCFLSAIFLAVLLVGTAILGRQTALTQSMVDAIRFIAAGVATAGSIALALYLHGVLKRAFERSFYRAIPEDLRMGVRDPGLVAQ